jgi:peptide methionine sulfoxide reductase MsrA
MLKIEAKKHNRSLNIRVEKFNWIYYKAEEYHQKYNEKNEGRIICH